MPLRPLLFECGAARRKAPRGGHENPHRAREQGEDPLLVESCRRRLAEPARDKSPPERRQLGEAQRLGRDLDEGALSRTRPDESFVLELAIGLKDGVRVD